jgi:CubicO group peptidase (beta-lactamase class C family)
MTLPGFSPAGLQQFHERLMTLVERRIVPGLVALISHQDETHVVVLGAPAFEAPGSLKRDSIFRIASITKPIAAAGAMALIDDGVLSLDDSIDQYLPELANRRVLRSLESPLDDTVPARRPITVEDLLTSRMGFGSIMAPDTYPVQLAELELGIKTLRPPWPPPPFTSDEWLARFSTLPLLEEPGAGWRYQTSLEVLGIVIERVTGQSLGAFLRERLFKPLGMSDTGFSVPASELSRFTTAYIPDPATGELRVLDDATNSWLSKPPAMDNAGGGLASTIDDLWSFVSMLLGGGVHQGKRLLSSESVAAMTRNHLTAEQRASAPMFLGEYGGWGYGMATPGPITGTHPIPWGFGWDGGTGTTWRSDPVRGLTGILLTQRAVNSPEPPLHYTEFWSAAYAALQ